MVATKLISALGRKFTFTVQNASAAAVVLALLTAFFDTAKVTAAGTPLAYTMKQSNIVTINAAGFNFGAILDDGVTITGVTCTSSNTKISIRQFREYIKLQAIVLKTLVIQASNEDCFNSTMEIARYNPLEGFKTDNLTLSTFKGVDQTSNTKIEMKDLGLPLDFETVLGVTIPAERTMTFTMFFE